MSRKMNPTNSSGGGSSRGGEMTAFELAHHVRSGRLSALEITRQALRRIEESDGSIRAFLRTTPEKALAAAEEVDKRASRGEDLPLAGVPVAVKDNLSTRGVATTAASRILEGFVAPYDATAVARMKEAGAVVLGKTNTDEFAMGSSTETSAYGATRNPWDLNRVPGGSSGGSAAAVAAGMVPLAAGTDTGGSIRQPAAFCGITGLRPTYGLVSRYGLVAYAGSLDTVGPMARDARDAALMLTVMAGPDHMDATSVRREPEDWVGAARGEEPLAGLRIGLPAELFGHGVDGEVARQVKEAAETLEGLGARVGECRLPHAEYAVAAYYVITAAEGSTALSRYDGVRFGRRADGHGGDLEEMYRRTRGEGFGREVKRRLIIGTHALAGGGGLYKRALRVRRLIQEDFQRVLEDFDLLLSPTAPTPAFAVGERSADPMAMAAADLCTIPSNLAGLPSMSIPCGFVAGLPVGLQLMAGPFREKTLFQAAGAFQKATDFHLIGPGAPSGAPSGGGEN